MQRTYAPSLSSKDPESTEAAVVSTALLHILGTLPMPHSIAKSTTSFLVNPIDLHQTKIATEEIRPLAAFQCLLRIEEFALTANNITYAVMGDAMGYWNFFPTEEGWGIIPAWGFATVLDSKHPEISVGERLYGYLPTSSHLVVDASKVRPESFSDVAAHRQPMSRVYNEYRRLASDPGHQPGREAERMLFEPLFKTSFLIEEKFRREDFQNARAMVLTSASCKTAMALAHLMKSKSPALRRVGLTSASNLAFVQSSGLYDQVLAYEAITEIDASVRTFSVDFAGNGSVLAAIHHHLQANLAYSCLVGATHWDSRGGASELPGPKPILFFAPDAAGDLLQKISPAQFQNMVSESWTDFSETASTLITTSRSRGTEAVERVYRSQLSGSANPEQGFVLSLRESG